MIKYILKIENWNYSKILIIFVNCKFRQWVSWAFPINLHFFVCNQEEFNFTKQKCSEFLTEFHFKSANLLMIIILMKNITYFLLLILTQLML